MLPQVSNQLLWLPHIAAIAFKAVRLGCHIERQDQGQCDFVDNKGQKYDVKLVLDNEQGQIIGDKKYNICEWIKIMLQERGEYEESIIHRDLSLVRKTNLFRILKKRLHSIGTDENAILFFPFPIVNDEAGRIFLQLGTDFLQAVYSRLEEDGYVGERNVFFIYPSMNRDEYILRNGHGMRENIRCEELGDYIVFCTRATLGDE
jgi:hypothetical protein